MENGEPKQQVEDIKEEKKDITEDFKSQVDSENTVQQIYKSITGKEASFDEEFRLLLSMDKPEDKEVLDALKSTALPPIKLIVLCKLPSGGDSEVTAFLTNSVPEHQKEIGLGGSGLIQCSYYIDGMVKAFKRVTQEVGILSMDISASELECIVKSSHNSSILRIEKCKLPQSGEYDFSLPPEQTYSISTLNLQWCGTYHDNDWAANPGRLEAIVEAVSKSGLKHSLKQVYVSGCGVSKEEVGKMFTDRGMSVDITA